jgi:uncharacterized protein
VAVTVTQLAIAPVKGLRLSAVDEVEISPTGVVGDRAFLVVGEDNGLLLTARAPTLLQVAAHREDGVLALTFPDGRTVAAAPEPGARAETANYEGRRIAGRLIEGELAEALSEHLQRPVRLLARDATEQGADDAPVTLMSEASLAALGVPDARRFRMTIAIDGVDAWEEHGWGGRELAVGSAILRVTAPVGRCVVTTRDPDSGKRDAPTLKTLATLRGKDDVTFGVWCEVVAPGRVRVGDVLTA